MIYVFYKRDNDTSHHLDKFPSMKALNDWIKKSNCKITDLNYFTNKSDTLKYIYSFYSKMYIKTQSDQNIAWDIYIMIRELFNLA